MLSVALDRAPMRGKAVDTTQIRLPLSFDVASLQADLAALRDFQLAAQPGHYHEGGWKGIALHARGGVLDAAPTCASTDPYAATAALTAAPYMAWLLDQLDCPKAVVRLLALPPGAVIGEHCDADVGFAAGLLRLHVPVITHPDVVFTIGGTPCRWSPGELWYGDFTQLHAVANRSVTTRVHIVADVAITPALLALFPPAFVAAASSAPGGIVLDRPLLQMSLAELTAYVCRFHLPASIAPAFVGKKPLTALRSGSDVMIVPTGGDLVALIDDEPCFALDPVGGDEFRVRGLAANVIFRLRREGHRVADVLLTVTGLPADLFAVALGMPGGPIVPQRTVRCDLLDMPNTKGPSQ